MCETFINMASCLHYLVSMEITVLIVFVKGPAIHGDIVIVMYCKIGGERKVILFFPTYTVLKFTFPIGNIGHVNLHVHTVCSTINSL